MGFGDGSSPVRVDPVAPGVLHAVGLTGAACGLYHDLVDRAGDGDLPLAEQLVRGLPV